LNAAFGSAGERCMAISVLVVIDSVADDVVSRIEERIAEVRVGDGRDDPDMGPLITAEHRHNVASYIDEAQRDGANVVVDGRGLEVPDRPHGFWLGPTLLDRVPQTSRAYTEEIFGPVLSIIRVKTYDDGVELINSGPFGNGTAIFTRDGGAARQFSRDVQIGMVGVNVPIPVPVATHSFGGWRDSIFGDTKAYGPEGFRFFTREKAVTVRWADPSGDRGLNLGFPQND